MLWMNEWMCCKYAYIRMRRLCCDPAFAAHLLSFFFTSYYAARSILFRHFIFIFILWFVFISQVNPHSQLFFRFALLASLSLTHSVRLFAKNSGMCTLACCHIVRCFFFTSPKCMKNGHWLRRRQIILKSASYHIRNGFGYLSLSAALRGGAV